MTQPMRVEFSNTLGQITAPLDVSAINAESKKLGPILLPIVATQQRPPEVAATSQLDEVVHALMVAEATLGEIQARERSATLAGITAFSGLLLCAPKAYAQG